MRRWPACLLASLMCVACGGSLSDVSDASTGGDPSASASGTADSTSASSDSAADEVPARLLDLTDWKLTLPIDDPDDAGSPLEILQPELATFVAPPHFEALAADRVRFRAHAGGATTSGSGYPRSELREMTEDGAEKAAWSTTEGAHTMTITQAITHLPEVKPHVVAGQIHDASDDIVMIRLEGARLFVEGDGDELGDLDTNYALGTEFTVRIHAEGGMIDVYYNDLGAPAVSVPADASGCYFKAGIYTQSNLDKGDNAEAYGEVEMSALTVEHSG